LICTINFSPPTFPFLCVRYCHQLHQQTTPCQDESKRIWFFAQNALSSFGIFPALSITQTLWSNFSATLLSTIASVFAICHTSRQSLHRCTNHHLLASQSLLLCTLHHGVDKGLEELGVISSHMDASCRIKPLHGETGP